jgi:hypothetical protein
MTCLQAPRLPSNHSHVQVSNGCDGIKFSFAKFIQPYVKSIQYIIRQLSRVLMAIKMTKKNKLEIGEAYLKKQLTVVHGNPTRHQTREPQIRRLNEHKCHRLTRE